MYSIQNGKKPKNVKRVRGLLLLVLCCVFISTSTQAATKFYAKIKRTKLLAGEQQEIITKGKKITYKFKSSKKQVVYASKLGILKAKKKGKAIITIRGYRVTKKGKILVGEKKVKVQVYACSFKKTTLTVGQGAVYDRLKIGGNTLNRKIRYTSSDTAVCTVDGNGVVRGIREGFAKITIQVGAFITYTCNVSVTARYLGSFDMTLLVNSGHRYGTVDLRQWVSEKAKEAVSIVHIDISDPSLGVLSGNVYRADKTGTAEITVWAGAYSIILFTHQVKWQAHRGYMDIRPENTNDAFEAAAIHGADRIETDVRFTKDGGIVLFHDAKVDAMTDGTGSLSTKTMEEVRALQIDNGNGLSLCVDRHIPLLGEFLSICRRYGVIAVLHVKTFGSEKVREERAKSLYQEISRMGMLGRTIVVASNPTLLKVFRDSTNETVPLAAIGEAIAAYQSYGIANCTTMVNSVFGGAISLNYSPVVGQQALVPSAYRLE